MAASHVVGIDLGTSNCALAFAKLAGGAKARVEDFPIPQVQRPGQVAAQPLLPSCLYGAGEHELPPGSARLPWGESPEWIAGEFARWQGARVPGRLVASAKSWLCHAGVDRSAAILPWGAAGAVSELSKLSPAEGATRLLAHLARAWDAARPDAPLAAQEVVITVPASFDEVARALTVRAAQAAGLGNFTLLEEPQAAFYAFAARESEAELAAALAGVRLVLVADVGGGTTDFTLIEVGLGEDGPSLRRLAVGEHLMLGGDNMDAALARRAEARLPLGAAKLSALQWAQWTQAARAAKEELLTPGGPERLTLAVAGAGSRLVGATVSAELERAEVEDLILEGFFPFVAADDRPRRAARVGLQELGLPFAQDAAITRHLAAFLARHAEAGRRALEGGGGDAAAGAMMLPRPDAILLNGGVFHAERLRERLVDVVSAWWPDAPRVPLLPSASLDLAVARGAARYGLVRRGLGRRIGGGAAQAFFIGLTQAQAGRAPTAVCVIPRGQEEGRWLEITAQPFALTLGQPVQFPLYSTTADRVDAPGAVVEIDEAFHALPPLHTLFRAAALRARQVRVHLRAALTELGTLELWCVSNESDERWRLEFELRGATAARSGESITESMPERFAEVRALVDKVYGSAPQVVDPREVKGLGSTLEAALGEKETWRLPLLRELWSVLYAGAARRRRSAIHERGFFRLIGYGLRPGFGYPLDEWRCEQAFRLFAEGVSFHSEAAGWNEFWILWRRIAGGLREEHHAAIWAYIKPHLARRVPANPSKNAARPKGVVPDGLDEMVRAAASLEHLDPVEKGLFGDWIVDRLRSPKLGASGPWAWALGRLGARVPMAGSVHRTVAAEKAAKWLEELLTRDLRTVDGAPFAAVQLARLTGDRARDLDEAVRIRAVEALTAAKAPERWLRLMSEVVVLEADDEARALGDTLPLGLRLG